MNFDFSAPEYHELALWEDKATLRLNVLTHTSPCWKINRPAGTPARTARLDL